MVIGACPAWQHEVSGDAAAEERAAAAARCAASMIVEGGWYPGRRGQIGGGSEWGRFHGQGGPCDGPGREGLALTGTQQSLCGGELVHHVERRRDAKGAAG